MSFTRLWSWMDNILKFSLILLLIYFFTWGCTSSPPADVPGKSGTFKPYKINGKTYHPLAHARGFSQKGVASWYGKKFHGRKTANGEIYNMYAMTAAHKTLPMNTWVQVTNTNNGKQIVARINDRGPFVRGRIIDLSYTGAKKLEMLGTGTAPVKVVALGKSSGEKNRTYTAVDYWRGNFTVQVGAFTIPANAANYMKKLSSKYENGHITTYRDDRGLFYRVRVGRFTQLEDAEKFSRTLMGSGVKNAFPVAE